MQLNARTSNCVNWRMRSSCVIVRVSLKRVAALVTLLLESVKQNPFNRLSSSIVQSVEVH